MNDTETKREKIEMAILSRLQRESRRRAAVNVLKPLIERANVPVKLKRATLSKMPNGVPRDEIDALGDHGDVAAVIEKLKGNGMIRLNPSKNFEANVQAPPELSQHEAEKFAERFLGDWPETERAKIVGVFHEAPGEKEDSPDEDE